MAAIKKYHVIGPNDVGVPTDLFKVITVEDWQCVQETQAYILPNQEIATKTPLDQFLTTVQRVEKAGGFILSQCYPHKNSFVLH